LELTILAVTKSYNGFCIAGMTSTGKWIRPISNISHGRFWSKEELITNGRFIMSGDVWEIEGKSPETYEYQNHTEDYLLTEWKLIRQLEESEFLEFIKMHCEGSESLSAVFEANRGRSLCLVRADQVQTYTTKFEGKNRARMLLSSNEYNLYNPRTNNGNIVVKDCKWEILLLNGKEIPEEINHKYICIALATPNPRDGIEYPQIVGFHTFPNVLCEKTYPD